MSLKVFAGISLRNEEGVHFGTLVRIRTGMAGVQTDAYYEPGDMIEFQLELTGFDTMVQGLAQVLRADRPPDDLSSYLLRIRKMRRNDQALLQEWYEQQLGGDEPSLRSLGTERALDSQVESQLHSAVGAGIPAPPNPAGGRGRSAIRDLLINAIGEPAGSGDTGGAAAEEPSVALDDSTSPPRLLVSYRTQGAWRRDGEAQLSRGMLFVHLEQIVPLPLDAMVALHIQRPPQAPIDCMARVVLLHDRGVGLSLDLDPRTLSPT